MRKHTHSTAMTMGAVSASATPGWCVRLRAGALAGLLVFVPGRDAVAQGVVPGREALAPAAAPVVSSPVAA
ncbi:MAG: hypothetical protein ABI652_06730, partial [Acidobacteriota bacterium]